MYVHTVKKEAGPSLIISEPHQIIGNIYASDCIKTKIFRTIPNSIKSNYETRTHISLLIVKMRICTQGVRLFIENKF